VVANGKVYAYVHDVGAPKDTIICLSFRTGKLLWRRDLEGQLTWHGGSGSPCVAGNRLLVSGAKFAYCLNADTGRPLWKTDMKVPPAPGQECSSSFLVIGNVAIVMAGETQGLDVASGKVLWRAPTAAGYASVMTSAAPWSHEGNVYAVYSGMGGIVCVAPETGKVLWQPSTDQGRMEPAPSPAIVGDAMVMFFGDELVAYRLALAGPEKLWSMEIPDDYSSPVIWDGRVYTVGFHMGAAKAGVRCRELSTGKVLWDTPLNAPQFASPLIADGRLFVFTDVNANLRMLDAATGRVLGSTYVGAQVWSSPSFADGKLLVRTPNGVRCWDLSAKANPVTAQTALLSRTERYLEVTEATRNVCGYSCAHQDTSIAGTPLRIGDKVFAHGIGTHAVCDLVFPLESDCRWVTFYVGASGDQPGGSVTMQVYVDDRLACETPVIRGQGDPVYISLPVAGARQVRLVGGDAGDGLAWDRIHIGNLRVSTAAEQPAPDGP
jgi:outer membrane protein assembly factor BamB